MGAAVSLREDFNGARLRVLAKAEKEGSVTRRLLALAEIYDGARGEAARIGGVGLQTIRDWVLRFNDRGLEGLVDGKAPGQIPKLKDEQRRALAALVEAGPIPAIHGVVRWRLVDLAQWIFKEYRISVSKQILSRELRAMGYRKLSARPHHHAQAEGAIEEFKKNSQPVWTKSRARRTSIQPP
jgi:transposase